MKVSLVSTDGQEPEPDDVHEAAAGERRKVCATLTAVLAADPVSVWLMPKEAYRHALATVYSRRLYEQIIAGGGRVDTARNSDGVALWYPTGGGGCHPAVVDAMRRDFGAEAQDSETAAGLAAALAEARDRFDALDTALAALAPEGQLYQQLAAHAVRPKTQNAGIGRRVLEHGHRRLDPGTGVFVVVSSDSGWRFYNRAGYAVTRGATLPDDGPELWAMWRDPGEAGR